jgi:hypothetical protein
MERGRIPDPAVLQVVEGDEVAEVVLVGVVLLSDVVRAVHVSVGPRPHGGIELRDGAQVLDPDVCDPARIIVFDDLAATPALLDRASERCVDGDRVVLHVDDDPVQVDVEGLPAAAGRVAVHADRIDPRLVADATNDHGVAGLEAARRRHLEAASADRDVLVEHRLSGLVSRHCTGRPGDANERCGAAAEAATAAAWPAAAAGDIARPATAPSAGQTGRGCGNGGGRSRGPVGRDGRPARAGADEDGPGVAHPFAAQDDAAGADRDGRRHPVVAGPEQHRAAKAVPVERQPGHLVDRVLDVRRVIPRDRPDRFLDGDRGNGHAAPTIPGMRGVVNDVALVVRNVDQLAVGARIDA